MPTASMDRRQFLHRTTAASFAAAVPKIGWTMSRRPIRVLMLGGTGALGPFLVREARAAGLEVTLLNRGITNPELFADLPLIRANRLDPNGLRGLDTSRFDAVLDTWQGDPRCVADAARELKPQVQRYVYISSVSVYSNPAPIGITEQALRVLAARSRQPDCKAIARTGRSALGFAERKALAEMAGERALGRRFVALRAHGIALPEPASSPHPSGSPRSWLMRLERGGEVLAPGDGKDPTQFTDPVELARFATRAITDRLDGAFNVFRTLRFEEYLYGCKAMWGNDARITWTDLKTLRAAGELSSDSICMWSPRDQHGLFQISHARADAVGIRREPLISTLRRMTARHDEVA